ncbi:hypothetical protein [Sphingomonas sp. Root241]|uniref:hypothetical protein n=1 Tax=Sphingomonas sp. Root241 TaxID=1736501 RepID=UPI0012E371B6|nr:hypothetical protein [Sphingomonas sp. Root241]
MFDSAVDGGSIHPEAIRFEPFAAFPAGAELAKVVADPTRPDPYVVRVKVAGGIKLLPHTHPEDRVYLAHVTRIEDGRARSGPTSAATWFVIIRNATGRSRR